MKNLLGFVLSLCLLALPACAQQPRGETPLFSQAELDQMLAPIALYPDQLLSQVLMAATYPLEVVQAARWSREHPGLQGQSAVRAVDDKAWDPSVKSLVAFPNLLAQMDADLDWTERLGDAFLAQQQQVMDTIQSLRERAYEAGNLRSGENIQVVREREVIYVRSAYPDVVYVPYYDPFTIYGSWWWPQYRPVYWAPWPGYATVGYASHGDFFWGTGIALGFGFFYSDWDWHDHYVRVVEYPPFYYRRPPYVQHVWVHDYHHRRGVPYRHEAVERRFVPADAAPVRRHDYGDQRDRDRDYRYREDYDGGREREGPPPPAGGVAPRGGEQPGTATGPRPAPVTPVSTTPAPREDRTAPRHEDRGAAPGGNTDSERPPRRVEGTVPQGGLRGNEARPDARTQRLLAAPAPFERGNDGGAPQPAERPATPERQSAYRPAERPAASAPERIEPRPEQRSTRPEMRSTPVQRYPAPETRTAPLQRNPTPIEPPRQARPDSQPDRGYPQAAPQRAPTPAGGGFRAPEPSSREPSYGGAGVQRVEMPQPRQPEPRSQPAGGGGPQRIERGDGGRGDGDGGGFRRDGGGGFRRGDDGGDRP